MSLPFTYQLDKARIAARPVKPYDKARLLCLDRAKGALSESVFSELDKLLGPADLLVLNNTSVNKARLFGAINGGSKEAELLILKREDRRARALGRPMKNLKPGTVIEFKHGLKAEVSERVSEQELAVEFSALSDLEESLDKNLLMPIPPYIRSGRADELDESDYQSLFAKNPGSIAAPTASLHFTPELTERLKLKGIAFEYLTLHIGMASVRPLYDSSDPEKMGRPGEEYFICDAGLMQRLSAWRAAGRRIIAVGTTAVRALETMALTDCSANGGKLVPTSLFIRPGFEFRMIDGLITNFHFPGSSHLLLVEAFIGIDALSKSYNYALENGFRFLSYGDGMLIT